ncbi:MAG: methylmalonyl-CoA mutase family protein [Calditrichia bacterium]
MAIQLIINKELGLAKNENPLQGAYIIEELTDLVEEAVYWRNSGASPIVAVCLARWKRCISATKFRKNRCIMNR